MKEMIKNYRGTLISSGMVILAGILVGFTSIQGKWLNVFFIVMQCALVTIIFYDNRNRQQSRKVIGMTIWIIPVITLIYNGIGQHGSRYREFIYGIDLLWNRFNVYGYRKLSAKGKTEQYDRNQGRMDIAG